MAGGAAHPVLDKLEAGQTDGIERDVVRAAHALDADGRHAQVAEGLHPFLKDAADVFVLLQINAAELSCSVILVEIDGKLLVLRRNLFLGIAEMLEHILPRPVKTLFLAAPEGDPDRPPRTHADGL